MTLRLVQPGEQPADETMAERKERADIACTAIQAAADNPEGQFWLMTSGETLQVDYLGDSLTLACVAEEVARKVRLSEIGFGE